MRQKILLKNIKKWWRIDKEKSIEVINNGGWHFNNLFSVEEMSTKLKTFAHEEYEGEEFSNIEVIKKKVKERKDLFNRGWVFDKVNLDSSFPDYILNNQEKFKDFID